MPKGYILTTQPQDFSKTATLVHRLRHPLRTKRFRDCYSQLPKSPNTQGQGRRRRNARDRHNEESSPSDSPHELPEIEDKGDLTKQRYYNADVYWNSVMVEASKLDGTQYSASHEYKGSTDIKLPQQTKPFINTQSSSSGEAETSPKGHTHSAENGAYKSTPSRPRNTNVPKEYPQDSEQGSSIPPLTWNAALTFILNSPAIDPVLAQTIKARASTSNDEISGEGGQVDMRNVAMVPNFSFPIQGSSWVEAWYAPDAVLECAAGEKARGRAEAEAEGGEVCSEQSTEVEGRDGGDDVRFSDLEGEVTGVEIAVGDEDPLYNASTSVACLLKSRCSVVE